MNPFGYLDPYIIKLKESGAQKILKQKSLTPRSKLVYEIDSDWFDSGRNHPHRIIQRMLENLKKSGFKIGHEKVVRLQMVRLKNGKIAVWQLRLPLTLKEMTGEIVEHSFSVH